MRLRTHNIVRGRDHVSDKCKIMFLSDVEAGDLCNSISTRQSLLPAGTEIKSRSFYFNQF